MPPRHRAQVWLLLASVVVRVWLLCGHFGNSEVILATRGHPGRPWEQQDGHEVVRSMTFIDFGVILEPVYVSFCYFKTLDMSLFSGVLPEPFLYRFLNRHFNSRDSQFKVFAWKVLHKSSFLQNRFSQISDSSGVFWEPWEPIFRFPSAFKTSSKTNGFLVMSNVLFKAPGSCR